MSSQGSPPKAWARPWVTSVAYWPRRLVTPAWQMAALKRSVRPSSQATR